MATYNGTSGNDTYTGGAGNDLLYGNDGNDLLDGDLGNDEIYGGNGNDTLRGNSGTDGIEGGPGNDLVDGGAGADTAYYFSATSGVVVNVFTGTASGGAGNDTLVGIEHISGSAFNDSITGDDGYNYLIGDAGNDTLAGSGGDDVLDGGAGNDSMYGGAGIDNFYGAAGDDFIDGGDGTNDTLNYFDAVAAVAVDLAAGRSSGGAGNDTLVGVENAYGSPYPDLLVGNAGANYLNGAAANDTVLGGDGGDDLWGDLGDDSLVGGGGADLLLGGANDDILLGGAGNDAMDGGTGIDVALFGGNVAATRVIASSSAGYIIVIGPDGTDLMRDVEVLQFNDGGYAVLQGAAGNDTLAGGVAPELINGGAGNDAITGASGNDFLIGGAGNDTMAGGDGIDFASYSSARSQYTLGTLSSSFQVTANATTEGTDVLGTVERLQFSDGKYAIDLGGGAGSVAKVLGAVFGAAAVNNPSYVGIVLGLVDGGMSYEDLMQLALDFALGGHGTNAQVVTLLYTNIVGVAPDIATRDNLAAYITGGGYTQATFGTVAADTEYNANNINLTGLAQQGLAYLPF